MKNLVVEYCFQCTGYQSDDDGNKFCVHHIDEKLLPVETLVPPGWCPLPNTDPVQDKVCADLMSRSAVGLRKYGKSLPIDGTEDLLQHAYEEALDLSMYLAGMLMAREEAERVRDKAPVP